MCRVMLGEEQNLHLQVPSYVKIGVCDVFSVQSFNAPSLGCIHTYTFRRLYVITVYGLDTVWYDMMAEVNLL